MTRRKDVIEETPGEGDAPEIPGTDTVAEAPAETSPPPPTPAPTRKSGIMGPILGGALAALGGFGLSHFNVFGLAPPDQSAEIALLGQRLETAIATAADVEAAQSGLEERLSQRLDTLAADLAALQEAPAVDLSGLADLERRLQVIETLPAAGDASTAALTSKLADLERQISELPAGGTGAADVDAALARLAAVEAEAQARAAEAAALADAAAQARARDDLVAAIQSGASFEAELAAVADPDLQAALAPHVAGVMSLADLQAGFPDLARATLQLARANDAESGWGTRLVDFLAAQTGARSLTPRDGNDPDAILARAEFALGEGRLADALAELAALDEGLRAPFQNWITAAGARIAVETALGGAL